MPIYRVNNRVIYFAHIPKCGGTTVEKSLVRSGLSLSFYNPSFSYKDPKVWSKTSPQHITRDVFENLFEDSFFDFKFAVVRDPVSRFLSAFNHNRLLIGRNISIARFVRRLERNRAGSADYFGAKFDNHFVPANRFLPAGCKVFRLEDGIEMAMISISELLEIDPVEILPHNIGSYDLHHSSSSFRRVVKGLLFPVSPRAVDLEARLVSRIRDLYEEDLYLFDK